MEEVSIIGIDLAKHSFQVHGGKADGSVAYRRRLSRGKLLSFLASQPPCTVAMEACGSAHYWGREIAALGHEVRLVPPIYVKPFVKTHKNDSADAEAISEAAQRPTMHFTTASPGSSTSSPSPVGTVPTPSSSSGSQGRGCSSSMTGGSLRSQARGGTTSSKSSTTAMPAVARCSPARSPSSTGTMSSAIPPSATPSSTDSSIMRTGSPSRALP